MDCDDCLERLYEFLDQELSEQDVKTVRRHLDACSGCADHFFFEERFLERVRHSCESDRAPESLRQSIILRMRAH
jgi:mycothiol system anti-sigma-R factor